VKSGIILISTNHVIDSLYRFVIIYERMTKVENKNNKFSSLKATDSKENDLK